jgi:nitrogen fixation/metabolism regulation signal transduction histidine kinase
MINQNLYYQVVTRVIIIVLLALVAGSAIAIEGSMVISAICLFIIVPVTMNLISFLNTANREMSRFLHSIQQSDSILTYKTDFDNRPFQEFYQGLNKLNKQIQQLKLENEHREHIFEILLENVDTGIITFKKDGTVLHMNSAARKLLSLEHLTHIRQLDALDKNLSARILNISPFEQRIISIPTKTGSIDLSIKSHSIQSNFEDLNLISFRDISLELDEKEQDSWIKLIRVIMHEMMNSITPMTSLSESLENYLMLNGQPIKPDQLSENSIQKLWQGLDVIKEQGKSLMSFVDSYRELSRLPVPDKKLFKLKTLFNRIKVLYSTLPLSKRVKFAFKIDPPEMELFADENMISQVLINLLKNAVQATSNNPEGIIYLEAHKIKGNITEIRIIDNGVGIPPENLEQIFIPFFSTHTNGTGIGLSLSRQIMRLHGGRIKVHSIPKIQTIFTLTFNELA